MTLTEFYNNYNLHDSFIESLRYNNERKTLDLDIAFAFWLQQYHEKGKPENGVIKVVFNGVNNYLCKGNPTGAFVGILGTEMKGEKLIINFSDDKSNKFFEMVIQADSVDIID